MRDDEHALGNQIKHNCTKLLELFDGDARRTPASIAESAHSLVRGLVWVSKVPKSEVRRNRRATAVLLARVIAEFDHHERKQRLAAVAEGGPPFIADKERLPDRALLLEIDARCLDGHVERWLSVTQPPVTYAKLEEARRRRT